MATVPKVPTRAMSNQDKLDFLIDAYANGGPSTLYGASLQAIIDDIPRRVVKSKVKRGTELIDLDQEIADSKTIGLRVEAKLVALTAAVEVLAKSNGSDPDFIKQAIDEAVDRNLAHLTATVTIVAAPALDAEKDS